MNEETLKTGVTQVAEVPPAKVNRFQKLSGFFEKIKGMIPPKVVEALNKFYSNKKMFLAVTIPIGLILLTIIIGLIFGGKNQTQNTTKSTPTPAATVAPSEAPSGNSELDTLKNRLDSYDVRQSRLQPPVINFDIKF